MFKWHNSTLTIHETCKSKNANSNLNINIKSFEFLFKAINSEFPPIFSTNLDTIIYFERYSNSFEYHKRLVKKSEVPMKALYICSQGLKFIVIGRNIFQCNQGGFVSYL